MMATFPPLQDHDVLSAAMPLRYRPSWLIDDQSSMKEWSDGGKREPGGAPKVQRPRISKADRAAIDHEKMQREKSTVRLAQRNERSGPNKLSLLQSERLHQVFASANNSKRLEPNALFSTSSSRLSLKQPFARPLIPGESPRAGGLELQDLRPLSGWLSGLSSTDFDADDDTFTTVSMATPEQSSDDAHTSDRRNARQEKDNINHVAVPGSSQAPQMPFPRETPGMSPSDGRPGPSPGAWQRMAVHEQRLKQGQPPSEEIPRARPRARQGQLSEAQRLAAASMRRVGACQSCRMRKAKCDPGTPCKSCISYWKSDLVNHPCRPEVEKTSMIEYGETAPLGRLPTPRLEDDERTSMLPNSDPLREAPPDHDLDRIGRRTKRKLHYHYTIAEDQTARNNEMASNLRRIFRARTAAGCSERQGSAMHKTLYKIRIPQQHIAIQTAQREVTQHVHLVLQPLQLEEGLVEGIREELEMMDREEEELRLREVVRKMRPQKLGQQSDSASLAEPSATLMDLQGGGTVNGSFMTRSFMTRKRGFSDENFLLRNAERKNLTFGPGMWSGIS